MVLQSALSVKDLPQPPKGKRGWPWTLGTRPLPAYQADGSEWPRLSIVTPSYNQGRFLEEAIRSVLLQGYPNLEYILIDGSSTDESLEVIRRYERFLSFWVSEADDGQADAVNKGLRQSTGRYLGWLNSDDMYAKGTIHKVIHAFRSHPNAQVVHGNRILIDEQERVFGLAFLPEFHPPEVSVPIYSETAFWTRDCMEIAGLLDLSFEFSMDLEFFTRLFLMGNRTFLKLNNYLGFFRCHSSSKSTLIPEMGRKETDRLWHKLFSTQYPHRFERARYEYMLQAFRYPRLLGFPILKTKIERIWAKRLSARAWK
jgi:glycosyltransferase involved in cell wall biosynthesis